MSTCNLMKLLLLCLCPYGCRTKKLNHKCKILNFLASTDDGQKKKQLTLSSAGSTISIGPAVPKVYNYVNDLVKMDISICC